VFISNRHYDNVISNGLAQQAIQQEIVGYILHSSY
jgi:hypothetical protein